METTADRRRCSAATGCALLLTLIACCAGGDSSPRPDPAWVADVQARAHALSSIDVDAVDDSDLAFLDQALAGRRVVELGESTHGAAQYSRAKTRLVKHLHEQLGFDVLVWESSLLAHYLVDRDLDARSAEQAAIDTLPAIWHTEDVVELFAYVKSTRATSRPLHLAGMDASFSSTFEETRRPALLRDLVATIDPAYADAIFAIDSELAAQLQGVWRTVFQSEAVAAWEISNAARLASQYRALADFLALHEQALVAARPDQPALPAVARQAALGTVAWFESFLPGRTFRDLRDAFMADSFDLVAGGVFPTSKLIVWAHDSHLFKAGSRTHGAAHTGYRNAGQIIAERHGTAVYMVSLLMNQGSAADGLRGLYQVKPAAAFSIEGLLRTTGAAVAFLDLAGAPAAPERAWMDQEFVFRDFGLEDVHAIPREQMDGVLYFESIDPPIFIDP